MKLTKDKLKQLIKEELDEAEVDLPWAGAQEDPLHKLRQDALGRIDVLIEKAEKIQNLNRQGKVGDMPFEDLIIFLQEWRMDLDDQET